MSYQTLVHYSDFMYLVSVQYFDIFVFQDGKKDREMTPVETILEKVTQARYTFAELQESPLPEGVDPLKLESYLEDEEFEEVLEMSKEEFYLLPQWQQHKLQQQVDLF